MRDEVVDYATRLIRAGVPADYVWPRAFHGVEVIVPGATISKQAVRGYTDLRRRFRISPERDHSEA
jgi:hypothetical protein